jgi:hypothetical protein
VSHEEALLPNATREILQQVHGPLVGHGGVDRTLGLLDQLRKKDPGKSDFLDSWVTKRADVKRFIKTCPICQKVKNH